jgi:hypothetical protein
MYLTRDVEWRNRIVSAFREVGLPAGEQQWGLLEMSAFGGYCCKSRKSNNPKNLAKADLLDFSGSVAFQSRQEGPWSILDEAIWSLTSPRVKRISGSKNFSFDTQKDLTRRDVRQESVLG